MIKRTSNFFGIFLLFLAGCMIIPLLLALAYGENSAARAFMITIVIAFIPGIAIKHASIELSQTQLKLRDSYFIVASSWIVASVIGALPYLLTGSITNFFDAFFETASGFTTTGATIINDLSPLPKSILFWRSFTQWLGGMGIIVLFVALLPSFGVKARNIASAETPGPTVTKLSSRFSGTAQMLYGAYLFLTALLTVLLLLGKVSLYDAVTHAMATMATGGFSTYNEGVSHFNNNYVIWVLTIFMFLAGVNFNLYFVAAKKNGIKKALQNEELKLYFMIVVVSTTLCAISLTKNGIYDNFGDTVRNSAFQVVTMVTTTGFSTGNYAIWPTFCQMLIVILMLTGACSSSTSGGIKMVRILVFLKMIKREVKTMFHDNVVDDIRLDGKKLFTETFVYIVSFISMYIIVLIVGTLIISLSGDGNLISNFSATLSCIGNVGPGLDLVGPYSNFNFYSDFSTFVLAIVMIAGRLELMTFVIIFSKYFWKSNKA